MIKNPTEEQQNVIDYEGNIVVTAKPGSGKTFTIVEKIARIIPDLPDYKGVIAISFTNKASNELKQRCKIRCENTKQSFFGTIDKFYISQIIYPFASHITGVLCDFNILELNDLPDDDKYAILKKTNSPLSEYQESLLIEALSEGKIFLEYTGETALIILLKTSGAKKYLQSKYTHIIIDEYQDCGDIQHRIFSLMVDHGLIGVAVGDINQAIYGYDGRFPKYLISLISQNRFKHYELSKNHRCHIGISEYSLCLFRASKLIPKEKRVFLVKVSGGEEQIASKIDFYIEGIKKKYKIQNNKDIAILCRSNTSVLKISSFLSTPNKVFKDTVLDKNNSDWGRFFKDILTSRFDDKIYSIDYAEKLFSEEYEPIKYRAALSLCNSIFTCRDDNLLSAENDMISLAQLLYPTKRNNDAIEHLHTVLSSYELIRNYMPASNDELNIMTIHKSKGLEFKIVFHMDMYKWIIPHENMNSTDDDYTQDLNLHYVGVTRAIDACYIMLGSKRYSKKYNDYVQTELSPFLTLPGLSERRLNVNWN
ncbi:MAG: ATP-dependent helicase [Clostridia bacterium]|nr:ATP-dependent helicase [Clostridia bacterium]